MCDSKNDEKDMRVFEKCEYTWILHEFSAIRNKYRNPNSYESPLFPEEGRKYRWCLKIYPNGKKKTKDYVSVYLRLSSSFCYNVSVKSVLNLKNSTDELIATEEGENTFEPNGPTDGCVYFVHRDKLTRLINDDDVLKLQVTILIDVFALQPYHVLSRQEEKKSLTILSQNLNTMLKSNKLKDFIIKFSDKTELPVHRAILAARSPVFSAMFEHNVLENNAGCVEITDVDKNTMTRLIIFLYTGELQESSEAEAMKLLTAADKYEIADLKERCSKILEDKFTVLNALDILILADLHNALDLKQSAIKFILLNSSNFSDKNSFEKVKEPAVLAELLWKIFDSFSWQLVNQILKES